MLCLLLEICRKSGKNVKEREELLLLGSILLFLQAKDLAVRT